MRLPEFRRPTPLAFHRQRAALLRRAALASGLLLASTLPSAFAAAQTTPQAADPPPLYMKMTDDDVLLADMTLQRTLETTLSNSTISWRNTVSGNSGSVTPRRTYKTKGGFYCRQYVEVILVGSKTELYRDTACRDANGVWKPVE